MLLMPQLPEDTVLPTDCQAKNILNCHSRIFKFYIYWVIELGYSYLIYFSETAVVINHSKIPKLTLRFTKYRLYSGH